MSQDSSNPYWSIASFESRQDSKLTSSFQSKKDFEKFPENSHSSFYTTTSEVPLELRCPSCKLLFDSPVFLPCSHTFCKFCAAHLIETADPLLQPAFDPNYATAWGGKRMNPRPQSVCIIVRSGLPPKRRRLNYNPIPKQRNRFLCPTCQNIIKYGSEGIESLPKNINIEQAVDRFKNETRVRFPACERHSEFHMEKLMRCETCKCDLCPLCSLDEVHKNHRVAPITVLKKFKTVRRQLQSTTDALSGKIEEIGSNILQTKCVVSDINDQGAELKRRVDKECDTMIAQIEKRRQAMYKDVDTIVQRKKGKRQKEIKNLRVEFNEARQLFHQIQDVLQTDRPADFLKKLDEGGLTSKVHKMHLSQKH